MEITDTRVPDRTSTARINGGGVDNAVKWWGPPANQWVEWSGTPSRGLLDEAPPFNNILEEDVHEADYFCRVCEEVENEVHDYMPPFH